LLSFLIVVWSILLAMVFMIAPWPGSGYRLNPKWMYV